MPLEDYLRELGRPTGLPSIAGDYAGKGLVVAGDAIAVWHDLEAFGCRCDLRRGSVAKDGWDFLTINRLVETFPGRIEHAYSNEPRLLDAFIAARRNEYRNEFGGPRHTHAMNKGAKWHWPWGGWGTSALGAVLTGIGLGYERIVLAGVPLDDGPHNGEPHWRKTNFSREAADTVSGGMPKHWERAMRLAFDGKVKSLSGRTRNWLGAP